MGSPKVDASTLTPHTRVYIWYAHLVSVASCIIQNSYIFTITTIPIKLIWVFMEQHRISFCSTLFGGYYSFIIP